MGSIAARGEKNSRAGSHSSSGGRAQGELRVGRLFSVFDSFRDRNFKRVGNLVYLSGHLPQKPSEAGFVLGKVGQDRSPEEAKEAALFCALNICATLKHNLGDLDRVKSIVKLLAFVNCTDDFTQQPAVVNGCSDFLVEVFEDKGSHTRSAVGTNSLPLGVAVEIEAIVEVE